MTRVAIIGNAGGCNTQRVPAISHKISRTHNLPVHPIDHLQWRPGWVPVPPDEFARQHDALLAQERWIIDGWGPWDAIRARFEHADTIHCG